jgi:hypothetical protein
LLKAGINQPGALFTWKRKYARLLPTEMRRLQELKDENACLKRIVADLSSRAFEQHPRDGLYWQQAGN